LKTIKINNSEKVSGIAWEGTGLRLAMSIDSSIYFANIKPEHKWAYLSNGTIVFSFQKADRIDFTVVFWDSKNEEKHIKHVKNLLHIKAAGEFSCLI
jgi:WD repeat-containing protein 35